MGQRCCWGLESTRNLPQMRRWRFARFPKIACLKTAPLFAKGRANQVCFPLLCSLTSDRDNAQASATRATVGRSEKGEERWTVWALLEEKRKPLTHSLAHHTMPNRESTNYHTHTTQTSKADHSKADHSKANTNKRDGVCDRQPEAERLHGDAC